MAREELASGLCERCKNDAALPEDDFCADCAGDIEVILANLVESERRKRLGLDDADVQEAITTARRRRLGLETA